MNTYRDRHHAGQVLAEQLAHYRNRREALVLALPRGGVPVGFEVAKSLNVLLDVFLVRKLGLPGQEEFAIGAIASGGVRLLNRDLIVEADLSTQEIDAITARETAELNRREQRYREDRPAHELAGRLVIVVDDGLATGFSMRAAVTAVKLQRPAWLTIAVPVGAPDTCDELATMADELVCPLQPSPFRAVGLWYDRFEPTSDDEVRSCLAQITLPSPSAS
jgi:predicted phosphoribosyltransferase